MSDLKLIGKPNVPTAPAPGRVEHLWAGRYRCNICKDSGAVLARRSRPQISVRTVTIKTPEGMKEATEETSGEAPYAFACDCETGASKHRAFPRWANVAGSSDWTEVAK